MFKILIILSLIVTMGTCERSSFLSNIFSYFRPKSAESVSRPLIRDMERVPKPPKYPLYDLDSISLATPPPPPAMHPSSSLPVEDYFLRRHDNNYNGRQDDYRGRHENNHKNNNNKNNRHDKNNKRNHANRRRGQPTNTQSNRRNDKNNQRQEYINSPMATNIEPVKVSPALGRPLGYSEFMARPSNSFLDDPWNFDPFKQEMNAGLETSGLKYNYDPLGMETAESNSESMKHLKIQGSSSFLGDSHIQGNVVKQVGGYELQGNNYQDANYNNHGNGYDSLAGASEHNIQKNHQQKIEFTIETNADGGVSIEPVVDAQMTAPIGPSGYENFPRNGEETPSDMLPPIGSYSHSHGNGYSNE